MKRLAAFVLIVLSVHTAYAQGYEIEGDAKGGLFPYIHAGTSINEGKTGLIGGIGIKTYGKDYAPLGGQVELNYLNTGIQNDAGIATTGSLVDFNFMVAVTKFRQYLNYHMAVGPSIMFGASGGLGLYNFYPKVEAGIGGGKFMLKAAANLSLNSGYTNMYNFTICFYPNRKRQRSMGT